MRNIGKKVEAEALTAIKGPIHILVGDTISVIGAGIVTGGESGAESGIETSGEDQGVGIERDSEISIGIMIAGTIDGGDDPKNLHEVLVVYPNI